MKGEQANRQTTTHVATRKGSGMLISTLIMGVLAIGLLAFGYLNGKGEHIEGLKRTKDMVIEVLPLLILSYTVAGMLQVLVPASMISGWVGKQSGLRGIFIGCVAGGITPGGPLVSLPIAAGLLRAGVGVGTAVAYLTAWSLWAAGRIPLEIGILGPPGPRFILIRIACTFFFPPIAGLIARALFERT